MHSIGIMIGVTHKSRSVNKDYANEGGKLWMYDPIHGDGAMSIEVVLRKKLMTFLHCFHLMVQISIPSATTE